VGDFEVKIHASGVVAVPPDYAAQIDFIENKKPVGHLKFIRLGNSKQNHKCGGASEKFTVYFSEIELSSVLMVLSTLRDVKVFCDGPKDGGVKATTGSGHEVSVISTAQFD